MREVNIFLMLCMLLFFPLFAEDIDELSKGVRQRRADRREERRLARKRKREERILNKANSKSDAKHYDDVNKLSDADIIFIRNSAYDEIIRKCKQLSKDGEVTYFSSEDIEEIARNLKERK